MKGIAIHFWSKLVFCQRRTILLLAWDRLNKKELKTKGVLIAIKLSFLWMIKRFKRQKLVKRWLCTKNKKLPQIWSRFLKRMRSFKTNSIVRSVKLKFLLDLHRVREVVQVRTQSLELILCLTKMSCLVPILMDWYLIRRSPNRRISN